MLSESINLGKTSSPTPGSNTLKDLSIIESQLDRVLAFFPRVDAKLSGLFAVNSAMLTVAALNVKPADLRLWYVGLPAFGVAACVVMSFVFLYRCNFPDTRGGAGSLVYFVEIQRRREEQFIAEFEECTDEAYRRDLLGQVWRNSEILCSKYQALAVAIRWTVGGLVPFVCLLSATAFLHSSIPQLQR
jgi:hypothetical protein